MNYDANREHIPKILRKAGSTTHHLSNSLAYSPPCFAASVLHHDFPRGGINVASMVAKWAGRVVFAPGSNTLLSLYAVMFATPGRCSTKAGSKHAELYKKESSLEIKLCFPFKREAPTSAAKLSERT